MSEIKVEFTTTDLDDYIYNFAGRDDMEGYDSSKTYLIYEYNRDFVWPLTMMVSFVVNILLGYPISPITMCNNKIIDGGNRTTTLWLFRNNKFKITIGDTEYDYEMMSQDRNLAKRWYKCKVPLVKISNATHEQIAQIFENLNKGVQLTFGQKLENRKYKLIVDSAMSIIRRGTNEFPYRDLINRVWTKEFKKSKSRVEVAFAFQLLMGTMYGPKHFHGIFERYVEFISQENHLPNYDNLHFILTLVDEVDPENSVPRKTKSECFRRFAGPMIYDLFTMNRDDMKEKWQKMFKLAYNVMPREQFKALFNVVGSDRAKTELIIQCVSENVQKFLDEGKLNVTNVETQSIDDFEESD